MHITLRQLEVFTEIVKSGSTTQASAVLSLSQSAVSAALADLENQLSIQLFDRVGKRLSVNEYGRLLYPKALAILAQGTEIEQLFNKEHGALRIAASSTIGNYILPKIIVDFCRDHPRVSIDLQVGNTQDVVNAVSEFQADWGMIEGPCHKPELATRPWMEDELVLFTSSENTLLAKTAPLSLQELASASWILRESGSGTREVLEHSLLPHLSELNLVMELGNSEAIKHVVRYGNSVSCLSRRVISEQLSSGRLVELNTKLPDLKRTLYFVNHKKKHLSGSLKSFLAYCQNYPPFC